VISLHRHHRRAGFTLVELLITISIIAILASMMLVASLAAQEQGRVQKTRALITKLDGIIRARYESYRTRRVPVNFPVLAANDLVGTRLRLKQRVDVLRDLMRMEMPDRLSDIQDVPVTPFGGAIIQRPSASWAYFNRLNPSPTPPGWNPTVENQGAECLYMIVTESLEQEGDSRGVFNAGDVADTDGDGLPEFVDGWKRPIEFLRWAPGFLSEVQNIAQVKGATSNPSGQSVTITFPPITARRFTNDPSKYIRGAMAVIDPTTGMIDTRRMGRITGYSWTSPTSPVVFTCSTPTGVTQKPFQGGAPTASDTVVIMPPDPFDSRGAYPIYNPTNPDLSIPTYALQPLIFSAGGDKVFGIKRDNVLTPPIQYTTEKLTPFVVQTPQMGTFSILIGSAFGVDPTNEPGWYRGCDLDNITNHQLGNTR
jgi:prepilin-type N-terminal cleavage/methylation domain-containing protein